MPGAALFVALARLTRLPPLELPVDLVGGGVAPRPHPVLEPGEQHERDGVRRGRSNGADDDLRAGGDERRLRRDRGGHDLDGVAIRTRHDMKVADARNGEAIALT